MIKNLGNLSFNNFKVLKKSKAGEDSKDPANNIFTQYKNTKMNRRATKNSIGVTNENTMGLKNSISSNIINKNLYGTKELKTSLENYNRGSILSNTTAHLLSVNTLNKELSKSQGRKKKPITPSKKPINFQNMSKSQNPKKKSRNNNVIYSTHNFLAQNFKNNPTKSEKSDNSTA